MMMMKRGSLLIPVVGLYMYCLLLLGCTTMPSCILALQTKQLPESSCISCIINKVASSSSSISSFPIVSTAVDHDSKKNNNLYGYKTALLSATIFMTSLMSPSTVPAAHAVLPTLNEAIVEVSESSYPILKALDATNFQAFTTKIGDLLLDRIPADKLGKSIELAMDTLDSVSTSRLEEFNGILKVEYSDVKVDSCTLVPLPPMSLVNKFQTLAIDKVNPDKLATFQQTWKPSLDVLANAKTENAICLPTSRSSLDKLALAQADVGKSFGKQEIKAFQAYTGPVLKSSITIGKALSFVEDAKTLAPTASPQAKKEFAAAGKRIEAASKLEVARNDYADKKAQQAANKAKLNR
mmetsp:Transcript_55653/g.64244  ORF Transcript_55653/g.64244 Transcript_55653/m.64244 type:complete len:352 (-) Transcript_55653:23-1078(-)